MVAAGAGGASDQMARMMQAAIQKNNLMKQPMVVSLKGGASGAEALMYMKSSEGDANKVLIAYSLIYMLPLSAKIPFNWRELTPVSVVALDQFVLWDNTALADKTVKEFVDAAKAASPPFKMGGTGSKREDHVLTVFMEKKTGAKFSYLPYKSGGEAATQLVGNHTESNVNNPSENLEVWRAGQVRALCVFDKERIAYKTKVTDTQSWNDIPTCKEEGLDVQYLMLRAMFLPGKVTPEQTGVLRRPVPEGDADRRIQGLHGKAGAEADLPHRQGHGEVPRGGRQAQQVADDRGGLRREVTRRHRAYARCRRGLPPRGRVTQAARLDLTDRRADVHIPKSKSSSTIRPRRKPTRRPSSAPAHVDIVVSLLLLALALTARLRQLAHRHGLGFDRPAGRLFPVLSVGHPRRRQPLWPRRRAAGAQARPPRPSSRARSSAASWQVFVPTLLFCLVMQFSASTSRASC